MFVVCFIQATIASNRKLLPHSAMLVNGVLSLPSKVACSVFWADDGVGLLLPLGRISFFLLGLSCRLGDGKLVPCLHRC